MRKLVVNWLDMGRWLFEQLTCSAKTADRVDWGELVVRFDALMRCRNEILMSQHKSWIAFIADCRIMIIQLRIVTSSWWSRQTKRHREAQASRLLAPARRTNNKATASWNGDCSFA